MTKGASLGVDQQPMGGDRLSRRSALCIAVESFAEHTSEPPIGAYDALPFAAKRAEELARSLRQLGYDCQLPTALPTAEAVGDHVKAAIRRGGNADVLVVHVLSHGYLAPSGVYVVGPDGMYADSTNVAGWIAGIEDFADSPRPTTLFLVDTCHAGSAARLEWLRAAGPGTRAWVIAATQADGLAYDGLFTRAMSSVFAQISAGEIDFYPANDFVPFGDVVEHIRREVIRLGGSGQKVCSTPVDGSPAPPFFPNRRPPLSRSLAPARQELDSAASPFLDLDVGLDPAHFLDRASGLRDLGEGVSVGCFTGRNDQVRQLKLWLASRRGGLRVVTGGPGSGKSALLGIVVCAGHPRLRQLTQTVWEHLGDIIPDQVEHMAAVHLRERTLADTAAALVRQLGLPESINEAQEVTAAVAALRVPPLIVMDALDEAIGQMAIVEDLLLPLAQARRNDGSPCCGLLLGMRPWDEFGALRDLAQSAGGLIDLDQVPPSELRADLASYLDDLLELTSGYGTRNARTLRRELARRVADVLTQADRSRGGEFLSAAMFANWLVHHRPNGINHDEVEVVASKVPKGIPEMLELDLSARAGEPWLLSVLTAIAHAYGAGMPATVIRRIAPALGGADGHTEELTASQFDSVLRHIRFYLRSSPETDGTTLYRIFHQGLVDQLRVDDASLDALLDRLLRRAPIGPTGNRLWDAAEPYLMRNAIRHAVDAGRLDELLTAKPIDLEPLFNAARTPQAKAAAAIVREAQRLGGTPAQILRWRDLLAISAARYGELELAAKLDAVKHIQSPPWWPHWSTGGDVSPNARAVITNLSGRVHAVAVSQMGGRSVAVTITDDSLVRVWDLITGQDVAAVATGFTKGVVAMDCVHSDERLIVVIRGSDNTVRSYDIGSGTEMSVVSISEDKERYSSAPMALALLDQRIVLVTPNGLDIGIWDLTSGRFIRNIQTGHTYGIDAIACAEVEGRTIVVAAGTDEDDHKLSYAIKLWDLDSAVRLGDPLEWPSHVYAITCADLDGRPVAVCCSGEAARVLDLRAARPVGPALTGHVGALRVVAHTYLQGRLIIVTGDEYAVRTWDVEAGVQVGRPMRGHSGVVAAVSCAHLDGYPVAVSCGDTTVRIWSLSTIDRAGRAQPGHTGSVRAVAIADVLGRQVALSGGGDNALRRWDLTTGAPIGDPLIGHTDTIRTVACSQLDGRPVAVTGSADHTVRVWDLATGKPVGRVFEHSDQVRALACTRLHDRSVVVGGDGATVRLWDLDSGEPVGRALVGHSSWIQAITCIELPTGPVAVTGADDHTIRIWNLTVGEQIGEPLMGHSGIVNAVTCVFAHRRFLAVTGGTDGTVRVWDVLPRRHRFDRLLAAHDLSIYSVACARVAGRWFVMAAGSDCIIRTYPLDRPAKAIKFTLPYEVRALALTRSSDLVVGFGAEVAHLRQMQGEILAES